MAKTKKEKEENPQEGVNDTQENVVPESEIAPVSEEEFRIFVSPESGGLAPVSEEVASASEEVASASEEESRTIVSPESGGLEPELGNDNQESIQKSDTDEWEYRLLKDTLGSLDPKDHLDIVGKVIEGTVTHAFVSIAQYVILTSRMTPLGKKRFLEELRSLKIRL